MSFTAVLFTTDMVFYSNKVKQYLDLGKCMEDDLELKVARHCEGYVRRGVES